MEIKVLILLSVCLCIDGVAQQLSNPSMEGEPIDATMPDGWHSCQEGTTPDILPGPWGVETLPYDGHTYVGLITRNNATWEAIGQQFADPLKANACYRMSLAAAHSETYAGYNTGGRLRVWLGNEKCGRDQLILDVENLLHTEWKPYQIRFTPNTTCKYIIIESYHPEGMKDVKGNILIDKIRWPILCERT